MKNLFPTIILVALCTMTNAQISTELSDRIDYNEKNGNIRLSTSKDKAVSAKFLATDKARLQLAPETDLQLTQQTTDKDGLTHYKYAQHHAGVRVEGGNLIIHEKGGKAIHANGRLSKGLTTKKQLVFSEEEALEKAIGSFDTARFVWEMSESELPPQMSAKERSYPQAEIVWLPAEIWTIEQSCMAYKFDIFSIEPLKREWVYVNVETGNIELTINQIHGHNCFEATTCSHTKNNNIPTSSNQSEEETFATSNYAGEVEIGTDFDGELYSLKTYINNVKIQTYNSNHQREFPLDAFTSSDNTWSDPTAIDVHWGMTQSYHYYYDVHERYSYDNQGSDIMSWVHYGDDFPNAFWTGSWMGFGDGGENYSPLTSLDIVAHEFTHAITQHSTKLVYAGESGALNESFSDIFGELIEHYYHPEGNDWIIGSDVVEVAGKNGIRNLANPKDPQMMRQQPDTYLGEYWHKGKSDFGGVHINSGVQNYWFYLLMNGGVGINDNNFAYDVEGVGIGVATEIAYRMLNQLSPTATYEEARTVSIWIAEQVFSGNPEIAERTAAAWCAVGVGNDCTSDISCAVRDSLVLIDLYSGWDPNMAMDTWIGVGLNENRCVDSINLYDIFDGPGEVSASLALLSELKYLNFGFGGFTGYIPPELGQLSQLEVLNFGGNPLEGTLPSELANLTKLKELVIGGNQLSGPLPAAYGQLSNLEILHLNSNDFSGTLPPEWGNLTKLKHISVGSNNLSGALPPEWAGMDSLKSLGLGYNHFSGRIPDEYENLTNLERLYLYNNQFEGPLPDFSNSPMKSIFIEYNNFNFEGLEDYLYLSPNFRYQSQAPIALQRNDNTLSVEAGGNMADNTYRWYRDDSLLNVITGNNTIVADVFGMYKCTVTNAILSNPASYATDLTLESTPLYVDPRLCALRDSLILVDLYDATGGPNWKDSWDLTQPMSTWKNIGINAEGCVDAINLDDQNMTGTLPNSIYNLSTLRNFLFSDNPELGGTISPDIANLTNLEMFSVSSCNYSGTIPDEMGQLKHLEHFSINNNNFTGAFPEYLLNLTNLDKINISQNNFTGELPTGFANLTKLKYLSVADNQFTGVIPEDIADIQSLTKFYAYSNDFVAPLPAFSDSMNVLHIRYNNFTFDDVMNNIDLSEIDFYYNKQGKIPIYTNGNALYVNAGGNMADNTYTWYKDNSVVAVITGDNQYIPALAGAYYCKIANTLITNTNAPYQDLILESETYDSSDELSSVYPGDMDNNGVVNNYDALYWGLSNGYAGYTRPDATSDWTGQPSADWVATLDGINAKHQDADGNGIIDEADFDVISLNYGQSYITPTASDDAYSPTSIEAELVGSEREGTETTLEIKISLNNVTNNPVVMHGIAFDLDYESELPFVLMDAILDFSSSWLTAGDENSLKTVTNIDNGAGRMSFGITRGDHQNIIGIGEVVTLFVIVCTDIPSGEPTESHLTINSGSSISANQILTPLTGNTLGIISNPPPPPTTCIENDDNTLLLLPFDDNSPNGVSGEVPMQADITYDTGVFAQAADISNSSNGLTFSMSDNLNSDKGTLEVWVKPSWNGNDGQSHVILQAGTYGGILMEKDGGNYLKIILNRWASNGQPEVGIGYKVAHWQAGEWQHIAYTWGNGQILMYINGTIVASKNYTNLPTINISEFNIGRDFDGSKTWNGFMDELRISDVARSPQQIAEAVEACAPSSTIPLTCIDNDDNSLLLLPFEDTPDGISGETPVQADITYNTGTFGQAANIPIGSDGLTFSVLDNINTAEGTLEVWVKPLWNGNDGQAHTILQAGTWGGMLMQKDNNGYLRLILNRWGGPQEVSLHYKIDDWQTGQWKHIAYTWGNGQATMHINGNVVDATTYNTLPILNISEFNIGRDFSGGDTWDGLMDELRISNIARTPQEIADAVAECSSLLRQQTNLEIIACNFPNPFTQYTTIEFELLEDSPVILHVFDASGKPVNVLLNEQKTSGKHRVVFDANDLPAGMYYYTIQAGEYFGRKNMIIIR